MGWKDKFTFLAPEGIEHEVSGKKLKFYPISIKVLFSLKQLAPPIAEAFSNVLSNQSSYDVGSTTEIKKDERKGTEESKTSIDALTPQMAILRDNQKKESFTKLFEALTDQDNFMTIGLVLMDSLREEFDDKERVDKNVALEFMSQLEVSALREFITGLIKANAKVLGPLEKTVVQAVKGTLDGLTVKEGEEKPHMELVPKETTGPTSKTQSSNSSSEDSSSNT